MSECCDIRIQVILSNSYSMIPILPLIVLELPKAAALH